MVQARKRAHASAGGGGSRARRQRGLSYGTGCCRTAPRGSLGIVGAQRGRGARGAEGEGAQCTRRTHELCGPAKGILVHANGWGLLAREREQGTRWQLKAGGCGEEVVSRRQADTNEGRD
eukprot:4190606-Pleurochrysis_carterae.AAC.1